jgi:hypothetical protein
VNASPSSGTGLAGDTKREGARDSKPRRTYNHAPEIAAVDIFIAPTNGFDVLYALVILRLSVCHRIRAEEQAYQTPPTQTNGKRAIAERNRSATS